MLSIREPKIKDNNLDGKAVRRPAPAKHRKKLSIAIHRGNIHMCSVVLTIDWMHTASCTVVIVLTLTNKMYMLSEIGGNISLSQHTVCVRCHLRSVLNC